MPPDNCKLNLQYWTFILHKIRPTGNQKSQADFLRNVRDSKVQDFVGNVLNFLEFSGMQRPLAGLLSLLGSSSTKHRPKRAGRCHEEEAAVDVNLGMVVCVLARAYLLCRSSQVISSSLTLHSSTAPSHEMH